MKIVLSKLALSFHDSDEDILFAPVTYFYGQMGAGKTSIARLIDYCLGGDLDLTPALQQNFVSATLHIDVEGISLTIERPRDSQNVHATWSTDEESKSLILPSRKASGVKIPGTEVEVLSDLIFYLAGKKPPKVRRSKQQEDSDLSRLSIRDLLWYCYLDQDTIDSTFFHLDPEAPFYKRNKSRDVLRLVIGFHQELVSELESELQNIRERRLQLEGVAESLAEALQTTGVDSVSEILGRITSFEEELAKLDLQLIELRESTLEREKPHGVDILRHKAQILSHEIEAIESAIPEIEKLIDNDSRHINELLMLSMKFRRTASARAVLSGVAFEACPRCTQTLPERAQNHCPVCGQEELVEATNLANTKVLEKDLQARIAELEESVERHTLQLRNMTRRLNELRQEKGYIDSELTTEMMNYDSAYLSAALVLERNKASVEQCIINLRNLIELPRKVEELRKKASELESEEAEVKQKLREARAAAESDRDNLDHLESLFLDCLNRAKIPGINSTDSAEISSPSFLPEIKNPHTGDLAVTSFANLGSGGKKTLFKACFALALHRLSAEIGAILPTFIIIDSPMKNISERENREQFEGFHQLIYELVESELVGTQVILIDKEFCSPPPTFNEELLNARYMTPNDDKNPPLIRSYRGP